MRYEIEAHATCSDPRKIAVCLQGRSTKGRMNVLSLKTEHDNTGVRNELSLLNITSFVKKAVTRDLNQSLFKALRNKLNPIEGVFTDENGEQHEAILSNYKKSEVILSSGAIGSPQLLLSGIGPKAELEQMNISVVLNNQFVGKGMVDNPQNNLIVPFDRPVVQSLVQTVGIT
ncbi:hypothetical protein POM88_002114 [Heracleum sosnowskyi]|uniref:Glucose-methanol-choline oxidoreductase N-terminal domain-containing protein n=1 Tax=Heracleum sosnowskyi TaxID=360622 RepID=A0AAD8JFJ1_9APIA|nr:hypothetical protein POM88_002114 [Heracleum sosnowskyi]